MLAAALCGVLAVVAGLLFAVQHPEIREQLLRRGALGRRISSLHSEQTLPSSLPVLYLEIDASNYRTLRTQRDEMLQEGILALKGETWASGHARLDSARFAGPGKAVPVQIRLKPAWEDPYQDRKWPLQVKIQEGGGETDAASILGMQTFTAQSPATYGYLDRWLYLEDLRRAGILAPRTHFARLVLNGEDWGRYALQEGISAQMLQSQQRPDRTLVRVESGPADNRGPQLESQDHRTVRHTRGFARVVEPGVDEFGSPHQHVDSARQQEQAAARALLQGYDGGRLRAAQVFDAEQIGRYLAHANLWGARDGLLWRQQWFAYNPLTMRLEPIGYGAFSGAPIEQSGYGLADLAHYGDLEVMEAYARETMRIAQPDYLDEFESTYAREYEQVYLELAQEFASMDLELPWTRLPERQEQMLESLHPTQPAYAAQVTGELNNTVHVEICNLLRYPLAVDTILVGGVEMDAQADWTVQEDRPLIHQEALPHLVLKSLQGNTPQYVTLRIPADVFDAAAQPDAASSPPSAQFVTHVIGMHDPIAVDVHRDTSFTLDRDGLPPQPSLEEALERHPFLEAESGSMPGEASWLHVRAGSWQVDGDLILPDGVGLRATEPVSLAFDRGAILYARGVLSLDGPEASSIRLVPKDNHWGGILVIGTDPDARSLLHNVEIRGASGAQRSGLSTRGGITFYQGPVTFSECRILDAQAETAVHVVDSDFELRQTRFENVSANAFDADVSRGQIEQASFHNVRGNGIGLSGSTVEVRDTDLTRVYGAGISARQGGMVRAESILAAGVHIPVVSQGQSSVRVQGMQIARAWTAGFAAYGDALESGPAKIRASGVVFQDQSVRALVQEGSSVSINERTAFPGELDVKTVRTIHGTFAAMSPLDYRFNSEIELVGYELAAPQVRSGHSLTVTLYWSALDSPSRDYTVFTHILDSAGQVAVGWDNMPCLDACPTTKWRPGRLVDDVHLIPLPADLPAGEYRVALGLYSLETGERLPVHGPGGERVPDATVILAQSIRVRDG